MTTDYPKTLNYKPERKRNIGNPQTIQGDDFQKEGTGQGAKALQLMMMTIKNTCGPKCQNKLKSDKIIL